MTKKPTAAAFLAAMQSGPLDQEEAPSRVATPTPVVVSEPAANDAPAPKPVSARAVRAKTKPGRAQLKHFGGYLDDDTLEKIALLRVRLKKDNSELIKFAIEELHKKHNAKRAFGDA